MDWSVAPADPATSSWRLAYGTLDEARDTASRILVPTAVSTSGELATEVSRAVMLARLSLVVVNRAAAASVRSLAFWRPSLAMAAISCALSATGVLTTQTPTATTRQTTMPMTPNIVANQPRNRIHHTPATYVEHRAARPPPEARDRSRSTARVSRRLLRDPLGGRCRRPGSPPGACVPTGSMSHIPSPSCAGRARSDRASSEPASRWPSSRVRSSAARSAPSSRPPTTARSRVQRTELASAAAMAVPVGSQRYARPPVMPAPKFGPMLPRMTTTPPVMYSQPWAPTPSTTAEAPLLRTANRMPARPTRCSRPPVAP